MGNVIVSTANVPEGTCPSWIINLWPDLVALLSAQLQGNIQTVNIGSSTPAPADRDKPWLKNDADGYPDGQYWSYKGGFWLKKHPVASGIITLWEGDITTINTFDGGEAAAVSLTTGPMWEEVTAAQGRFPIHPGTMPSGSVIGVTATGGEETHLLTVNELPAHNHPVKADSRQTDAGTTSTRLAPNGVLADSYATTHNTGGDMPHNNLPPYYGVYLIRRTIRLYYRA